MNKTLESFIGEKFKFFPLVFFVPFTIISLAIRAILTGYALYSGQVDVSALLLLKVFLLGIISDLITFVYFITPLVIFSLLIPPFLSQNIIFKVLFHILIICWIGALSFSIFSEFTFWEEFGSRFNFIAVDYLVYTQEVVGNIIESYPITEMVIVLLFITMAVYAFMFRFINKVANFKITYKEKLLQAGYFFVWFLASFYFYDKTLTDIKDNRYASELAKNGIYNLFSAFRNNILDYEKFYLQLSENELFDRLKTNLKQSDQQYVSNNLHDISRKVISKNSPKKFSVVLIAIESMSAEFLEDSNLTPYLNQLKTESVYFSRYYATGTRTVRGLEAMTLSIPPTPGQSIVRRPNNENMFSIASVLSKYNYDSKFIYGGYGYFDNMNYFFESNGFSAIDRTNIDKKDIIFSNIWGVADEVLYNQVIKEADHSYADKKPFFSFVMTTSNHRPYTFPEGRINMEQGTRASAIKYADYSIGKFIEDAKTKPWFNNTIFVITADHCASSAGRTDLPVNKYHIPLLIYAPKHIKTDIINTLSSQIDLSPTILDIMNIEYESKFFGNSIFKKQKHIALMGTYQLLGYMENDKLIVLSPKKGANFYSLTDDQMVEEIEEDSNLQKNAISYYQGAAYLFKNGLLKSDRKSHQ